MKIGRFMYVAGLTLFLIFGLMSISLVLTNPQRWNDANAMLIALVIASLILLLVGAILKRT